VEEFTGRINKINNKAKFERWQEDRYEIIVNPRGI
jgi:hypothetical protein